MRRLSEVMLIGCMGLVLALVMPIEAAAQTCPNDSVRVGTICLDEFEASVWKILPTTLVQRNVIIKIKAGTVTLSDLKQAGAKQLGLVDDDLADNGCPRTGNGCVNVYAVSIAGVLPARFITWFQAVAAARNSFKRLPTNAEWQAGALGTPDPGTAGGEEDCNVGGETFSGVIDVTGARPNCFSDSGAWDMVGNVAEWVADWVPQSKDESSDEDCGPWTTTAGFNEDLHCLKPANATGPGALLRGGDFAGGSTGAGVFHVTGRASPHNRGTSFGFRAAR